MPTTIPPPRVNPQVKHREVQEKHNERIVQMARKFQTVFDNPAGREVINDIKAHFQTNYLTEQPDLTRIAIRAAQRDLIDYIERQIEDASEE